MDVDESSSGGGQCSRCDAGKTVMLMVQSQALWMGAAGLGDGRPPAALWAAVWAEDWPTVRSEWDKWVRPRLRELSATGRDWRATVAVMVQAAVNTVDSSFPADVHDAEATRREWSRWIAEQFAAARDSARFDEWARYSDALPPGLQSLAAEHPSQQAELAATTFEIEAFHRGLLGDEGI
ncbi:hypothetical protein [Mycolicibacterium mucogenicum]|uniref:hypothetical protein n=1 Tax=Mycolicibacterium mucogenicum TaxID=56689 RepID=UPI00076A1856|nr:hypothetical protein [Mycolicibacterium mucogenicum]